ncbi:Uncharacterised protein [Mycobacteroides abscessus]|nr:Uncharacterised protein [Mycobacteroides abscessus]
MVTSTSGRVAHTSSPRVSPLCVSSVAFASPPFSPEPGSGHCSASGVTTSRSSETTTCTWYVCVAPASSVTPAATRLSAEPAAP